MQLNRRAALLVALVVTGSLSLAACGSEDHRPASTGDPVTTTTAD